MLLSKAFLLINGLVLGLFGGYCLIDPTAMQEFANMGLDNAVAHTEVRAMYGGFQCAFGVYLILCGLRQHMAPQALIMMSICFTGLALSRTYGLIINQDYSNYSVGAAAYEACIVLIAVALLQYQNRNTATR